MNTRALIVGGYGLAGSDIYKALQEKSNIEVIRYTKEELDLNNLDALEYNICSFKPDVIINSAGYTMVDEAEASFYDAYLVNTQGVFNIISVLKKLGLNPALFHLSTDYVFDGKSKKPYTEEDAPYPLNKYGWTKLMAENIIQANYKNSYIIRSSGLFGLNGVCFPQKVLNKFIKNERVFVVDDQYINITYTKDLGESLIKVLELPYGVYNVTNPGVTTWFNVAKLVAEFVGKEELLSPVKYKDFKSKAVRPQYSALSSKKINENSICLQGYQSALQEYLEQISIK